MTERALSNIPSPPVIKDATTHEQNPQELKNKAAQDLEKFPKLAKGRL